VQSLPDTGGVPVTQASQQDAIRPWLVRADRVQRVRAGDAVRIRAQRWTWYVLSLDVLYRRASPSSTTGLVAP
jgi:hypothetical protein